MPAKLTILHAQQLASQHGGKCISTDYINSSSKLEWKCSKDHIWQATYASVKNGKWCLICSGNAKHSIVDAQQLAKKMAAFAFLNIIRIVNLL